MVPQIQGGAELANNPTVLALKEALKELESLKEQKGKVMEEGVQKVQNLNAIE